MAEACKVTMMSYYEYTYGVLTPFDQLERSHLHFPLSLILEVDIEIWIVTKIKEDTLLPLRLQIIKRVGLRLFPRNHDPFLALVDEDDVQEMKFLVEIGHDHGSGWGGGDGLGKEFARGAADVVDPGDRVSRPEDVHIDVRIIIDVSEVELFGGISPGATPAEDCLTLPCVILGRADGWSIVVGLEVFGSEAVEEQVFLNVALDGAKQDPNPNHI